METFRRLKGEKLALPYRQLVGAEGKPGPIDPSLYRVRGGR